MEQRSTGKAKALNASRKFQSGSNHWTLKIDIPLEFGA
jgi:hypothetical protein